MDDISSKFDEDIDLLQTFLLLLKQKKLIIVFSLVGMITGGIRAAFIPRTWQGDFQIVLEQNNEKGISTSNPFVARVLDLSGKGQKTQLKTQVEILKSPSVLMPVFDFYKSNNNQVNLNNLRFKTWKENLSIELEEGTSVLNLSYLDKNKKIIIPVLNKISTIYQSYVNNKKNKEINESLNFLEKQIDNYKLKSSNSFTEFQEFSITHDLLPQISKENNDSDVSVAEIESKRISAANTIRLLEAKKEKIIKLPNFSDEIMYSGKSILPDTFPLLDELEKTYNRQSLLKSIYKNNDRVISSLQLKKELLLEDLKLLLLGYLDAEISKNKSIVSSSKRPKEILIKFRQLQNEASRDLLTLNSLEKDYGILSLEITRKKNPWQLITNPTLIPYPVSPNKKVNLALGLISGFIIGCGIGFYREKKKNLILNINDLKLITKFPILENLSNEKLEYWNKSLKILSQGTLDNIEGDVSLFMIGNIDKNCKMNFIDNFKNSFNNIETSITEDLLDAIKYKNIILIISFMVTSKDELNTITKKLSNQKNNILGLIILPDLIKT